MSGKKRLERKKIVAFDDQVAVKPGLLALAELREAFIKLQNVVRDSVVVILDRSLTLELEHGH